MYRALSPIFDPSEFPPLRRVKPLPKRRRTIGPPAHDDELPATHGVSPADPSTLSKLQSNSESPLPPRPRLPSKDGIRGQEDRRTYFAPVGGRPYTDEGTKHGGTRSLDERHEDDDGTDGDYGDHLSQPGNTKKRKVPANPGAAADGAGGGGGDDADGEGANCAVRPPREYDSPSSSAVAAGGAGGAGTFEQKRSRMKRATLAGLQHKELLRTRKRQLAAVLGALTLGDPLALDQALSASRAFATAGAQVRVRLSPRRAPRLARAFRAWHTSAGARKPEEETRVQVPVPAGDFSFVCHSATSDRLVMTMEEVAVLQARFEQELARQAAKAAEAAKQAAAAAAAAGVKREGKPGGGAPLEKAPVAKGKGGKKKKRAALANAGNPHHLRNYVPSRLPSQGTPTARGTPQNLLSPLPLRFLAAELPPSRKHAAAAASGGDGAAKAGPALADPAEEWICPFCEYALFYGEDSGFQRAVRNRKKILRRRRRARERAAAAASGVAPTAPKDAPPAEEYPVHDAPVTNTVPPPAVPVKGGARGREGVGQALNGNGAAVASASVGG